MTRIYLASVGFCSQKQRKYWLATLCIWCMAAWGGSVAFAQNLNDLELAARGASGKDRITQLLSVAEAAITQGDYERSVKLAREAGDFAKKINEPYLRAQSLHVEGKALSVTGGKRGLFNKERPGPKFVQSNEILKKIGRNNDPLLLNNLEQLQLLAQKAGRNNEIAEIEAEMARAKGLPVPPPTPEGPLTRTGLRQELDRQKMAQDTMRAFAAKLLTQSKALQNQLAQRDSNINRMTESQAKTELMILQQNQLLDSLLYRSRMDSLMLTNQNLALREAEASRNFSYALAAILLLFFGGAFYSFLKARQNTRILAEKNKIIDTERERSERLLLNILPASVADELKRKGNTSARYFEDVSVLFADFVNFTQIAERITPQQLVTDLDTCFRAFDAIVERYGLEKIKTIGDAYLCAGGLQGNGSNQAFQMVQAAREMQLWLKEWSKERQAQGLPVYQARVGIHSGSVVAGVVGAQKFAFDIWGDTVNIAARIEQAGEPGRINLSGAAFQSLNNQVACNYRGKIPVKNKGEIEMFFVE